MRADVSKHETSSFSGLFRTTLALRPHHVYATPTACVRRPTFSDRSLTPDVFQPLIIASPPRYVRPTAMPYPYNIALAAGLMLIVLSCSLALVLT
jgi:hypothetical protein